MSPLGTGTSSDGGPVAPDGSPVGLYRVFPPGREPALIHAALPPGAAVLELGCGAGRITHALVGLGHPVVAVDQSADMLASVRDATPVHADIEGLDLGRRFPAVVLAGYLVNTIVPGQRDAFLATCRRHVADDGVVLVQRTAPRWAASLRPGGEHRSGEFSVTVTEARLDDGVLHAAQECRHRGTTWTHSWTDLVHSDETIEKLAAESGLPLHRWLDEDREWALLRPG
ncbi:MULTISPECIES: class I SAM-dependent methyltransferase [Streptomyces]|uniref:Class I SAM-dependent methyltransferase n=1 Tax=Streptomyces griseiscabiei TaxID=2993540 RepID=A0ABU4KY71_9ACTN|nr:MULTISPECIES: class I SAM-dependent methyltransferase [Streptomyces]MBZ3904628.1 class I SAM-dependent methyltransferase [Streptomyces griseiscabiei]MDX2908377.1 class I SAM-dependent methyltransferase [Streptomyces griseiscabiei]